MKIHRFYIAGSLGQRGDQLEIKSADVVRQIQRVLKLKIGESLEFFNGTGDEVHAQIAKLDARAVHCLITSHVHKKELHHSVTAYVALLKRDNFEFVVQKLSEMGIAAIVPLITARTIKTAMNSARLNAIAREAAELSGRTTLPVIHEPQLFSKAIQQVTHAIFFDMETEVAHQNLHRPYVCNAFFVGPEGGWTDEERAAAQAAHVETRQLGSFTLRGETAAIIGGYLTINQDESCAAPKN